MSIQYGRKRIEYGLTYSNRTTLAIDVHPDLTVTVTAPNDADDAAITEKMQKRAPWIVQQQRFFENYLPKLPPRKYVTGESHRYLGRQYRLRVQKSSSEAVKLARGRLNVFLPDTHADGQIKALVTGWFRDRADAVFGQLFAASGELAGRHGIKPDTFEIRRMKNRWGSCTQDGRILLNPELIIAPKPCIEYVIVHEICHIREHHHGPKFYRLLNKLMPDWQTRREKLNRCVS